MNVGLLYRLQWFMFMNDNVSPADLSHFDKMVGGRNKFIFPGFVRSLHCVDPERVVMLMFDNENHLADSVKYIHNMGAMPKDTIPDLSHLPNLRYLSIRNYNIDRIPETNNKLLQLEVDNAYTLENIDELPSMAYSLTFSKCPKLTSIPELPESLKFLTLSETGITEMPDIPEKVVCLYCRKHKFKRLGHLPPHLETLHMSDGDLEHVENFPDSLTSIDLRKNKLTSIPPFGTKVKFFEVSENELETFPELPDGFPDLRVLAASGNRLTQFPKIPEGAQSVYLGDNQLTSVGPIPESVQTFDVSNNQITNLDNINAIGRQAFVFGNPAVA